MLNTRTRKLLTGLLRDKAIKAARTNEDPGHFMRDTIDYLTEVARLNDGLGATECDESDKIAFMVYFGTACMEYGKEVSYNMNRGNQE